MRGGRNDLLPGQVPDHRDRDRDGRSSRDDRGGGRGDRDRDRRGDRDGRGMMGMYSIPLSTKWGFINLFDKTIR